MHVRCSRIGGPRATADALLKKGKDFERNMDVRAALRCYEVIHKAKHLPIRWKQPIKTS